MKAIVMVIIILTVAPYGFSDENREFLIEDNVETGNLFNNNENLKTNLLSYNPFFFNGGLNSLSYNIFNKNLLENIRNESMKSIITAKDKKEAFEGIMLWTGLAFMWNDNFKNYFKNNYGYFKNKWDNTIEEEIRQGIIKYSR